MNYQPTKDRAKKPRKTGASGHATSPEGQASDVKGTFPSTSPNTQSLTIPPERMSRSQSEPQPQPPVTITPPNTTGRIADRWTEPALIGVKPILFPSSAASQPPIQKPQGMVGRRALPGMVAASEAIEKVKEKPPIGEEGTVSPSPTKQGRIPSTGNRATVMDVAQALGEAQQGNDCTLSPPSPRISSLNPQSEKRKSSFEKYSSFTMPPLKEEKTPVSSPAGTLAKSSGEALLEPKLVSESPQSSLGIKPTIHRAASNSSLASDVVHVGELSHTIWLLLIRVL